MSDVPMCPVHHVPMKSGKGGFFCSKKADNGEWCKQRLPFSGGPPSSSPAAVSNGGGASPKHLLMIAALDFAGRVFAGTGDASSSLDLANTVVAGWREDL